jgi:hypothetical protein
MTGIFRGQADAPDAPLGFEGLSQTFSLHDLANILSVNNRWKVGFASLSSSSMLISIRRKNESSDVELPRCSYHSCHTPVHIKNTTTAMIPKTKRARSSPLFLIVLLLLAHVSNLRGLRMVRPPFRVVLYIHSRRTRLSVGKKIFVVQTTMQSQHNCRQRLALRWSQHP